MKSASPEHAQPRLDSADAAARKRAVVETYARNETALRRTARRYSLCDDDADEALQRALEILLHKAPSLGAEGMVKWAQTVVKREAMAIRSERERILSSPLPPGEDRDWVSELPAGGASPAEKVERREAIARSREALQALKPQELRALTLLAEGYSYVEIGEITGFSATKVNRCLAEGRERFRSLVSRSEDGRRCAEMRPVISAFCDGEAGGKEVAALREHLRACASCRATLRTYRAAPAAAAALAPALPLHRSLLERLHDAFTHLAARFGGERGGGLSQVAGGSGAGGFGAAAAAKVAALCIATAGGAAACVATGLVPAPLDLDGDPAKPAALERRVNAPTQKPETVDYEPAPVPVPTPEPKPDPAPTHHQASTESAPAEAEPAPEASEPAASSEAVEYAPPPAPAPEPAPVESSESGSPAGEFGP